ncbi:flavastacin isoform X2 [Folsomia candida]|uniref:Metalloendopeptidase n=1 Tax=Folsomia candida TaxID=158441 RepID=A0A226D418_FOLCA|nr:flavastacin isoform X2 [Folsomia candida]OXA39487.1 Meprin A subunit beta [Folsomia candida]
MGIPDEDYFSYEPILRTGLKKHGSPRKCKTCTFVSIVGLVLVLVLGAGFYLYLMRDKFVVEEGPSGQPYPEEMGSHFEGDIVVLNGSNWRQSSGLMDSAYRWPDSTIIYEFDPKFDSNFKENFTRAMAHIMGRTCIRFKPLDKEDNYIYVTDRGDCSSAVGMRSMGRQELSLGKYCNCFGTMVHEIVHALGFFHEQSRTDRDDYVTIFWDNIKPGEQNNFEKKGKDIVDPFFVPYDAYSIMHYGAYAFSKNGNATILSNNPEVEIGNRKELSFGDINKINNMYCDKVGAVKILSGDQNRYLTLWEGLSKHGDIINTDVDIYVEYQKWTVDWDGLLDEDGDGGMIWSWTQDGTELMVVTESHMNDGRVHIWPEYDDRSQKWRAVRNDGDTIRFMIKNLQSGRCLTANGLDAVTLEECNPANLRQNWYILGLLTKPPEPPRRDDRSPCGKSVTAPYEFPIGYNCSMGNYMLTFQRDGNLVIYDESGGVKWHTGSATGLKNPNQFKLRGRSLKFGSDGNLVLYNAAKGQIWSSDTANKGHHIKFGEDGKLVIFDKNNNTVSQFGRKEAAES